MTKLDLSGTKLKSIPDSVFGMTYLEYLDLGSKNITFFPPLSALTDSNANEITDVPEAIGNLISLRTLVLNSNKLTTLPKSIVKLTNLEILDLSKNPELDILAEIDKIRQLQNLKILKIVDTKLAKANVDTLKTVLGLGIKIILTIPEYLDTPL